MPAGSPSRIHPPSPSRVQSPSPDCRSFESRKSHRTTPIVNNSHSYRRRKALFGFGEPRARPQSAMKGESTIEEDRQPDDTSGSMRRFNSSTNSNSSKRSNISTPESRNRSIPSRLPQNRGQQYSSPARGSDAPSHVSDSSNHSVAGSAKSKDYNNQAPNTSASSHFSFGEGSPLGHIQKQLDPLYDFGGSNKMKEQDLDKQKEQLLEHVHSLHSALSEETMVSDISRNTAYNTANASGGDQGTMQQKMSKDPPEVSTELTQQKVISTSTSNRSEQQNSWWLQMFQRLEEKHETERAAWQDQLHSAKEKKHEYKEELRQNLSSQLQWLEEHLTAPSHVLPGIEHQDTTSTEGMSPEDSKHSGKSGSYKLQYHIEGPTGSSGSSVKGIEVTLDSANHMQRLHELERTLQKTNQQHEQDRLEWVRTLEEAASVTQAGEELSTHQQRQLQHLQREVEKANKKQKEQLDEKTAVLTELLELTEQQHASEKQAWQKEQEKLQSEIENLQNEKNELSSQVEEEKQKSESAMQNADEEKRRLEEELHKVTEENSELKEAMQEMEVLLETAEKQNAELKNEVDQITSEGVELHEEKKAMEIEIEKLHKDLQNVKDEARNFRAQEADYIERTTNMKSPPRRWLEDLDRAAAERDMYRQEAESLRKEVDEMKQNRSPSSAVVNSIPSHQHQTHRNVVSVTNSNSSVVSSPSILHYESSDEADIITKYREAAEKHGELVNRLKKIEDQRSSDRGEFKLKLEAALSESRMLEEEKNALEGRIEELTETHGKEVHDLNVKLRKLEGDLDQRCDQVIEINESSSSNDLKDEIKSLKTKLKEVQEEMECRCDQLVEKNYLEVSELKEKINDIQRERTRAMNEVRKLHEAQRGPRGEDLPSQLKATEDENRNLNQKVNELTKSLNEYKSLHNKAVKRFDQALMEKCRLNDELDAIRSGHNIHIPQSEIVNRIGSHQTTVINAVEELRKDVASVRDALTESSGKGVESSQLSELRGDLISIQTTLNEAVAELTLEADALIQSRDAIQNAAANVTESMKEKTNYLEQHERMMKEQQAQLMNEFNVLRENVDRAMTHRQHSDNNSGSVVSRELVADLQRKESALATAQTELRFCKEKLEAEITARKSAETEVASLTEQSDAFEEEIMTLRSANTKLIKKLRTAGMKIDAALLAGRMSTLNDDASTVATPRSNMTIRRDDSFGVLDEALALATGLSDIVGQGQGQNTTAMEMLESMHGLIDISESRSPATSPSYSLSPRLRHRQVFDAESGGIEIIHEVVGAESGDGTECSNQQHVHRHHHHQQPDPPMLQLPNRNNANNDPSALQMVVEQLYGRCELLERERIELMEATLDLLESARDANSSELAAALATARRRATEEIKRVHEQNYQDQERIFHKLCTQCVRGKGKRDSSSGVVDPANQENNHPGTVQGNTARMSL